MKGTQKEYAPKTMTGPHPARIKATCCVPNGVGEERPTITSINVDMLARQRMRQKALHWETSSVNSTIRHVKRDTYIWNRMRRHIAVPRLDAEILPLVAPAIASLRPLRGCSADEHGNNEGTLTH
jgi:hypothetical protein